MPMCDDRKARKSSLHTGRCSPGRDARRRTVPFNPELCNFRYMPACKGAAILPVEQQVAAKMTLAYLSEL
jgi:hypothetical protein